MTVLLNFRRKGQANRNFQTNMKKFDYGLTKLIIYDIILTYRGVAQFGRVHGLGP